MRNKLKNNSIMRKLFIPMMIVMLLQASIFVGTILWGGTIEQVNDYSFDILNERVINRKNYVQNEMIQRWSKFDDAEKSIQEQINAIMRQNNITIEALLEDNELVTMALHDSMDELLSMLRKNSVTGVFFILNDEKQLPDDEILYRSGVYLRDLNPISNPSDNSDILLERGSSSIAKDYHITMDSMWQYNFEFHTNKEQSYDFFDKPFSAAKKYPDSNFKDLGYWSKPFRLSKDEMETISYSIPLITPEGTVYGVLGVEITLDYLRKIVPADEISANKEGSYSFCINEKDSADFANIFSTGPAYKKIFGEANEFSIKQRPIYKGIYEVSQGKRITEDIYCSIQYIKLYNSNTPFEQEQWALVGIIEKDKLLNFSQHLETLILSCFFISLLIGSISLILTGSILTRPIKKLVRRVRESDPRRKIILPQTNIMEIDELASAVENLSQRVAASASKLSTIMNLVNLPIGAFEYFYEEDEVFCTDQFLEIWNVPKKNTENQYMPKIQFELIMKQLLPYFNEAGESVHQISQDTQAPKWLKLKTIKDKKRILGILMDVTQETLEKKKIEHDRDYDILTNLLNRRAFHNQMEILFSQCHRLKNAAFMMWDLDGLKYINDTYGHDYGDEYIKKAADVFRRFVSCHSVVARMSGDEFYVFLYGYNSKEDVKKVVYEVRAKIDKSMIFLPDGRQQKIRASAGVAWYPENTKDYKELVSFADFAMYKVKNTVKGEMNEFNMEEYKRDAILLNGGEELNRLIEEKLVHYAFQPIVDVSNGTIFAYEALMRPTQASGFKSPLDVLRVAQHQSKMYKIEQLTWFKVLESFQEQEEHFKNAKVFINSISNHILSDSDIAMLEKQFGKYLNRIVVELTESEQMPPDITEKKEICIRRWNSSMAIDDYGSGYNSEAVLLSVSPEYVKIDMSIVTGIDKDKDRQKILLSLLSYLKSRRIRVIAEGVETEEEMKVLVSYGIDYLQGFFFGRGEFVPQQIRSEAVEALKRAREQAHYQEGN